MDNPDYYLQHPRDQLFYKVFSNILTAHTTECNRWWGFPPRKYNFMLTISRHIVKQFANIVFLSQSSYIILHFKTMEPNELIVALSITPVGFLAAMKTLAGKLESFKKLMKIFMEKVHIYNSYLKNKNSEYVKKKVIQIERLSRFTANFLFVFIFVCALVWIAKPTIYNIRNHDAIMNRTKTFHYYIYICVPFDERYNYRNYLCLHILSMYIGLAGVTVVSSFDSVNFMFIYHFVGHIQILKYNLKDNWSDDFDEQQTRQFLIDNIKYHSFIIRTFKHIQDAFGINVATNYLQNSVEDGLFLYQLMLGDKENVLIYGLMMVIYVGGLILISIVLEEIRIQNDDLSDCVYAIPWEGMSISNQKLVMLLLGRTQPDLEFRATCGMKAGIQPAISILKSMFSYYVMIKARM